jgi:hypothetical protein
MSKMIGSRNFWHKKLLPLHKRRRLLTSSPLLLSESSSATPKTVLRILLLLLQSRNLLPVQLQKTMGKDKSGEKEAEDPSPLKKDLKSKDDDDDGLLLVIGRIRSSATADRKSHGEQETRGTQCQCC